MRTPSRIASLVVLVVLPTISQCQSGSVGYSFTSRGQPTIRVSDRMSELRTKLNAGEIRPLREDKGQAGGWTSVTVDYRGLEISYWVESDSIYYLWSDTSDWQVSDRLRIGAVFSAADFDPPKPIRTEGAYLLPYGIQIRERTDPAYCMVTVSQEMIITELSLFHAYPVAPLGPLW